MDAIAIRKLRERYGLSANSMSSVCGFGVNQWRNYENGMEPSRSNMLLIELIQDEDTFLKVLVLQKGELPHLQMRRVVKRLIGFKEEKINNHFK